MKADYEMHITKVDVFMPGLLVEFQYSVLFMLYCIFRIQQ